MTDYVVNQGKRPVFHHTKPNTKPNTNTDEETESMIADECELISWKNEYLNDICQTIEDCWDSDGDARLGAALIKEQYLLLHSHAFSLSQYIGLGLYLESIYRLNMCCV